MTLKSSERNLFEQWKKERGYSSFITDGLMDEDEWNKQPVKILFVLKEANWEDGNGDLCEFLLSEKSASYHKTWNNVARWTKAVICGGEYPKYVSKSDKSFWLRKVCAMNLKKVGGDSVAENDTIYQYANRDREFLKAQILLYMPDIIICCGRGNGKNADILHDVVFCENQVSPWQEPLLGYNWFMVTTEEKNNIPVLSFYHPQMRAGHDILEKRYHEMEYISKKFREMK